MDYALYISGLGQENTPHRGFKDLSYKVKAEFGLEPVFCSYQDDPLDSMLKYTGEAVVPKIAMGHSLGGITVTELRDICYLVLLDPVRLPWYFNRKPALTGTYQSLLIRQSGWFPPTVDAIGDYVEKSIVRMGHNEVVESDINHDVIIHWMKELKL
jgi:hypothetical protein